MAMHEFGIMPAIPGDERYDHYEPESFGCIAIHDDYIEPLYLSDFREIDCFWHTTARPEKNLAYAGITLIPPESLAAFLEVFRRQEAKAFAGIIELFEQAQREEKYIIHFGI